MIIPGALAAILSGGAVGAAASYLTSHAHPAEHPAPAAPPLTAAPRTPPASTAPTAAPTTGRHASSPSTAGAVSGPSPSRTTAGHALNDRGYALIQRGDYPAAVPLLRRAVRDLRGAGPTDPYEAYANYNLGYALIATGACAAALPPLGVANRLEANPLVDRAIRRASACAPPGS